MNRRLLLALLLMLAPLAVAAPPPAVEGRDYAVIDGGAPWQPAKGRIEVAEVFAYSCGHCARFQPMLDAWKRRQPKDVSVRYVPLPYGRDDALARGFFATRSAGALDRVHARLFRAVHTEHALPRNPTIDELAAWYGQQGLDAAKLRAAMADPALADRLAAARQFALRSGVEGTPTLIVDGRYRILGDSLEALLRNADAVIAQVRSAQATSAQVGAARR